MDWVSCAYALMTSYSLQNHLRAGRKRLAFTQSEVAFLMGRRGGSKICSYESFAVLPTLETALAFEIIYGTPVHELFPGIREQLAEDIRNRAKILRHRVSFKKTNPRGQKKRQAVESLISTNTTMP